MPLSGEKPTDFSVSGIIRFWGAKRDQSGRMINDPISAELEARIAQRPVAPGSVAVATPDEHDFAVDQALMLLKGLALFNAPAAAQPAAKGDGP